MEPASPLLSLTFLGHPALRMPALPIELFGTDALWRLAEAMVATMDAHHGIGLAAPQIGIGQRLIVFRVPPDRALEPGDALPLQVLLNPEIEPLDDVLETAIEGCLSLPGLRGPVLRHAHILYRGRDLDGQLVEREARGLHARVVQHELDHLDGLLYPDRMAHLSELVHESALRRQLMKETRDGEENSG